MSEKNKSPIKIGREDVNLVTDRGRELKVSVPVYEINGQSVVFLSSLTDSDLTMIKEGERYVCDD